MNYATLHAAIMAISPLSDDDFAELVKYVDYRVVKKRDVLLKEGQPCQAFYFAETGYLRSWHNKDGTAINLNFAFEGEFITNVKSIKNKQPSEFSIDAGEDGSVWVFNNRKMGAQLKDREGIVAFARRLAIRVLMAAEAHSNMCRINTPIERYHYIETHNPRLLQRVPLSQIASYLGVTRETLSRIRANTY